MLEKRLSDRLVEVSARFDDLERSLADPDVARDLNRLRNLGKEHADLSPVITGYRSYVEAESDLAAAREMLQGAGEADAAFLREEIATNEARLEQLEAHMRELLVPRDPKDDKDVIVEIRPAAGGDEAALFASDLFGMYTAYADAHRWKIEVLSEAAGSMGGYKEVIFAIKGKGAYSKFKYESGVHRVQRVPATESQGRIHTSTATVAVLAEAEAVDVEIKDGDLKIDVFRSSGPGGQSVNTTDSAVRITHLPTGEVVSCQEERSQLQNKERAMRILRARLLQRAEEEQRAKMAAERKGQVGTGDRSEKIRTYNFPQNRVTDHRVGVTLHKLPAVLEGDLDEILEALTLAERAERLSSGEGAD